MLVLEERSRGHQNDLNAASGDYEYSHKLSWPVVLEIFSCGPKCWSNLIQNTASPRVQQEYRAEQGVR